MLETRYDREFGKSTLLGDRGDNFFGKPLEQQVLEIGWSHACPVVDRVVKEYGPEWTLKRYAECNFVFGLIVESARDLNPKLYAQLITPTPRIKDEFPSEGRFNPNLIPSSFYNEMSPLSTPWGYALPRVVIEQMGRGKNNEERTQERILKALDIINEAVKTSKTPVCLLVKVAEAISRLDAKPRAVLAHTLSENILLEEGCKSIFKDIRREIEKSAPILAAEYASMTKAERKAEDIINF